MGMKLKKSKKEREIEQKDCSGCPPGSYETDVNWVECVFRVCAGNGDEYFPLVEGFESHCWAAEWEQQAASSAVLDGAGQC